jgi:hypothetical protein
MNFKHPFTQTSNIKDVFASVLVNLSVELALVGLQKKTESSGDSVHNTDPHHAFNLATTARYFTVISSIVLTIC